MKQQVYSPINRENYSHMIIIKVWDTGMESTTNYGNIESIVKKCFLENKLMIEGIELWWRKIVLLPLDKAFGLSDIVINLPFQFDEQLLKATERILENIGKELYEIGKMNRTNKIIFKIIKPLIDSNQLVI